MKTILKLSLISIIVLNAQILFSQGANNSLDFDNSNYSYVEISDAAALRPSQFTIEAWFKIEASTGNQQIIISKQYGSGSPNSYALYCYHSSGSYQLRFYGFGSSVHINSSTIQIGVWHHAAVTYNGTTVILYLNGIQVASANQASPPSYDTNPVLIGADNDDSNNDYEFFFNGEIDEVRIWNTAKSVSEIRTNMNKTLSGSETNLAAYWNFDASSGTTLTDQTANSNDGTLGHNTGGAHPSWITSAAKAGDESIFSLGNADISEKAGCMVDIDLSNEGSTYSYSVYQVNSYPNSSSGLLDYVADKYWEIKASKADFDGTFTASIDFHFDEVSGITDESTLALYRRDDATSTVWTQVTCTLDDEGNSSDGVGSLQLSLDQASSGDFSGQYIITSEDVDNENLPIELLSFNAEHENEFIHIYWTTLSELNNDYFIVEKSFDALHWSETQRVYSHGNSNSMQHYAVREPIPTGHSLCYYRLKQVDFDGSFEVFKPVAVNVFPTLGQITHYQTGELVYIELFSGTEGQVELDILNLRGQRIIGKTTQMVKGANLLQISKKNLPQGIYFLRISAHDKPTEQLKIFVN